MRRLKLYEPIGADARARDRTYYSKPAALRFISSERHRLNVARSTIFVRKSACISDVRTSPSLTRRRVRVHLRRAHEPELDEAARHELAHLELAALDVPRRGAGRVAVAKVV